MIGEYFIVPSILATGATKYLILLETHLSGLVVYNMFDDLKDAMDELTKLNKTKEN